MTITCAGFRLSIPDDVDLPLNVRSFLAAQSLPADLVLNHFPAARSLIGQCVFNADLAWELRRDATQRQFVFRDAHTRDPLMTLTLDQSDFPTNAVLQYAETQSLETWLFGYPTLQLVLTEWLADHAGLLVHACAVRDGDHTIVLMGAPGVGKSTSARLWAENGATVLSDDRIALRWHDNQWWAYGTPWHSSTPLVAAERAPIKAIFCLAHGSKNQATALTAVERLRRAMPELYLPRWDAARTERALAAFDQLITTVPVHELKFVPDASVVAYVRSIVG